MIPLMMIMHISMFNSFLNTFYDFFIVVFLHIRKQVLSLRVMDGQHQLLKPKCCFKTDLYLLTKNYSDTKLKNITKCFVKHCRTLLKKQRGLFIMDGSLL